MKRNERLIQSAPELLEACKLAVKAIYSGQNYHDGGKLPNDAIPLLESAIAAVENYDILDNDKEDRHKTKDGE